MFLVVVFNMKEFFEVSLIRVSNFFSPEKTFDVLLRAIQDGDIAQIKRIESTGFDLNYKDAKGNNILQKFFSEIRYFETITEKTFEGIYYICDNKNFNINAQNYDGNALLHFILMKLDTSYLTPHFNKFLITLIEKSNIELPNKKGRSPLICYFCETHSEKCIKRHPFNINLDILTVLLKKTPNINFTDNDGQTVIHYLIHLYLTEDSLPFTIEIWNKTLEFKPNLNSIDKKGVHILDIISENSALYKLLVQNGASPVHFSEVDKLLAHSDALQKRAHVLVSRVKEESAIHYRENEAQLKIKASEGYLTLNKNLNDKMGSTETPQEKAVSSEKELKNIKETYVSSHYVFANRSYLRKFGKTTAYLYPKLPLKGTWRLDQFNHVIKHQLGWQFLPKRLSLELTGKEVKTLNFGLGIHLNHFDFTESEISLILHATDSTPSALRQNLNPETCCFNDMVYLSCSLVGQNSRGFTLLSHDDAPFRVFFVLSVDPRSIFAYSQYNLSSPYSRRGVNPTHDMIHYLKELMKESVLSNYLFSELQTQGHINLMSHKQSILTQTGIVELESKTAREDHNEILVMGNQVSSSFGASPIKVIALAVDINDIKFDTDHKHFREVIRILNDSGLPVLLCNFSKNLTYLPSNYPFHRRVSMLMNDYRENKEILIMLYRQKARLGDLQNLEIEKQIVDVENKLKAYEALLLGLEQEGMSAKLFESPNLSKTSEKSAQLFKSFCQSELIFSITRFLSERDKKSMTCVNKTGYGFFTTLVNRKSPMQPKEPSLSREDLKWG